MNPKTLTINESDALKRLDKVLTAQDETLTRTRIKQLIDEGFIKVNDETTKPSYKVKEGDVVSITFPEEKIVDLTPVD